MNRQRLDVWLADNGLVESRSRAQQVILAGLVRLDGRLVTKPGTLVRVGAQVTLQERMRYVSRAGVKAEAALDAFGIKVGGRICADIGSSTGGFTDCLLQRGAARVYAIDVGKGLLHWKLRNDPRVIVKEGVNARYLRDDLLPERVSLAVVDVSFISLRLILPAVLRILDPSGEIVSLIKPQFEAGRREVGKGGVVHDEKVRQAVIDRLRDYGVNTLGLIWRGVCPSPIRGPAGNIEYLVHWTQEDRSSVATFGVEASGKGIAGGERKGT